MPLPNASVPDIGAEEATISNVSPTHRADPG